jgi:hypothetical protein
MDKKCSKEKGREGETMHKMMDDENDLRPDALSCYCRWKWKGGWCTLHRCVGIGRNFFHTHQFNKKKPKTKTPFEGEIIIWNVSEEGIVQQGGGRMNKV